MKKFLLLILLVFTCRGKAQNNFILAGQHGVIYVDIVPDVNLQILNPANGGSNTYSIDINQDGTNDIFFDAHFGHDAEDVDQYFSISALDSNTSFSYAGKRSTGSCANVSVLNTFSIGDTIKNGSFITSGYLSYSHSYFPTTGTGCNSSGQADTGNYIGVKYQTGNAISYGWVKIVDTNDYVIKEFSLGAPMVSIKQYVNNEQVNIYPNPAKNILHVEINANVEIEIFDVLGNEVINAKQKQIDISGLQNGIYFINVKTSEGILTK